MEFLKAIFGDKYEEFASRGNVWIVVDRECFAIMNACGSCVARCLAVSTISAISFFSFSLIAFLTSHSFIDFLFLLPYTFMYRYFHAE